MDVTLIAVATPFAANVLDQVVHAQANTNVSLVIAIVIVHPLVSFTNVIAVHIGYATLALLSIVHVLALVSADG